jgi:proteasome accessory factor B
MPAEYSRLHRLFALIQLIAGKRGLSARDIAAYFEMHERTVRRDIEVLNSTGIPCYLDPATGGYVIRKGFLMPPVEFSFEEALSLLTLMEQIPSDSKIPFQTTAHRALNKLRSQFRDEIKDDIENLDGRIHIDLARGSGDDGSKDVYDKVRDAIASRRVLRCRYEANHSAHPDAAEELFDFRPYTLWYAQRSWYAVGLHCGRNEVRQLKLNRFDYVERTDKPYAIPDDFSMKSHLGNAWRMIRSDTDHNIAIRFDKGFADTVTETHWHPTQHADDPAPDGSITLHFTVAGFDEIQYWILSYGPHAQVLHPPELITRIRNFALATAQCYPPDPR